MESVIVDGVEYRPFNHLYAVSRCGKFLRNLRPTEPKLRPDGYLSIGRRQLAHRLVASVWCEKPADATHVHHINGDKADNRAENLEWVTPKQHFGERHENTGKHTMSDAGKAKLRALRAGSTTSEETKAKQRAASIRLGCKPPPRPVGYRCSEESKAKMRDNSPNALRCKVFGVDYSSMKLAAEALGIKRLTLRKRCYSENFPDYQLLRD